MSHFLHVCRLNPKGRLTLHFLPGDAPDLNPDELVWSYTKRTSLARRPLRSGEKLADRVHDQLSDISSRPDLAPSVLETSKCLL
ncbi:hypothetical protein IXO725_14285, partial [Xanthomonas oryzae pv. oryzae]